MIYLGTPRNQHTRAAHSVKHLAERQGVGRLPPRCGCMARCLRRSRRATGEVHDYTFPRPSFRWNRDIWIIMEVPRCLYARASVASKYVLVHHCLKIRPMEILANKRGGAYSTEMACLGDVMVYAIHLTPHRFVIVYPPLEEQRTGAADASRSCRVIAVHSNSFRTL